MINIRRKVFETNSSSTHSICMCSKDEYDEWISGKVYLNNMWFSSNSIFTNKNFVTREEIIDIYRNSEYRFEDTKYLNELDDEMFAKEIREDDFYTYDNYFSEYLEDFFEEYVTKSGEKIVAFGQYGYDG